MADEPLRVISVDYVAGQLEGIKDLIRTHAGNTAIRFDKVDDRLDQQDEKHDADKREAIEKRDKNHADNQARFGVLEGKMSEAYGIATTNRDWIKTVGQPTVDIVAGMIDADKAKKNRAKGAAMVWGSLGAAVAMAVTVATTVAAIGIDNIKAMLEMAGRH